jgi:hypothetical protein
MSLLLTNANKDPQVAFRLCEQNEHVGTAALGRPDERKLGNANSSWILLADLRGALSASSAKPQRTLPLGLFRSTALSQTSTYFFAVGGSSPFNRRYMAAAP